MKRMKLCLCVAAVTAAILQVSAVYAQVKVAAPGVDASVSGKGVSVNAPGVSLRIDIPPDFDVNDPTGDGKKATAKSTTKSSVKSAGGAGTNRGGAIIHIPFVGRTSFNFHATNCFIGAVCK